MDQRIIRLSAAALAGIFWGWIVSSYILVSFSRTSAWVVVPWGIMGILVGLLLGTTRRSTLALSLVYGEALTTSFLLSGAHITHPAQILGLLLLSLSTGVIAGLACFAVTILMQALLRRRQKHRAVS